MKRTKIFLPPRGQDGSTGNWGKLISNAPATGIGMSDLSLLENGEYIQGKIRKRPGCETACTTLDEVSHYGGGTEASTDPRAFHNFILSDGTQKIMVFERGATGALVKKIYVADAGTWSWATLKKGSADFAMQDSRAPRFLTFKGNVFFSNGDCDPDPTGTTDGLVYWPGAGDVASVHDSGDYGISTRFLTHYREILVGANGYYYDKNNLPSPYWNSSRLPSGLFFSSLFDSNGDEVTPDDPEAWWENWMYRRNISEDDGGEIVALWTMFDAIYVGKTTGIWRVYFQDISKVYPDQITNVPMESDHSLKIYPELNGCVFRNQNDVYFFDGKSEPKPIGDPIGNLLIQVPNFDVGGESDFLDYEIDANWNTEHDTGDPADPNISYLANNNGIEIDKTANAVKKTTGGSATEWQDFAALNYQYCGMRTYYSGVGFMLTSIDIMLKRLADAGSGTCTVTLHEESGQKPGVQIGSEYTFEIEDISTSGAYQGFDFSDDDIKIYTSHPYWIVIKLPVDAENQLTVTSLMVKRQATGATGYNWSGLRYREGISWVMTEAWYSQHRYVGNWYEDSGEYNTIDDTASLGGIPTEWGTFEAVDSGHPGKIKYYLRTSTDGSTYPDDFVEIVPGQNIEDFGITPREYVDIKIELEKVSGVVSPWVKKVTVNAVIKSTETTDRLACSGIINNCYHFATNKNLDGTYRTFVLSPDGKWNINPDQLIRAYLEIEKEMYLVSVDTNTKIHKMHRGTTAEQFNHDYSLTTPTGQDWYYLKMRTKKFDCTASQHVKLMKGLRLAVGSIFEDNYVQGILKYRMDNDAWTTVYFPKAQPELPGDIIIRHIFPSGTRGMYIQFQVETYRDGADPPEEYGTAYNILEIMLDFFIQHLKPILKTTTAELSETGHMVAD